MKPKVISIVTGSLLFVGLLAGCSSKEGVSFTAIRNHLSPELAGVADRPDDIKRDLAVMADMDSRMFWDDVQRTLYIDQPSRLSPYPIIYTSGNPR